MVPGNHGFFMKEALKKVVATRPVNILERIYRQSFAGSRNYLKNMLLLFNMIILRLFAALPEVSNQ
jgi:hypothetical protein